MFTTFTRHPRSVGESYLQHFANAARYGLVLVGAGGACMLHAAIPCLFEHTASRCVRRLHAELDRRNAAAATR